MTKALLLLTGGRGLPDMLVMKHLQPDIVLNITTARGLKDAQNFEQFSQKHFDKTVKILSPIDPFNEQDIKMACKDAIESVPDAEWIIHFTGAPKVVGIYAHDIARDYGIPFCFLDTEGQQLISLVKELPVNTKDLFEATVEEYMGAYGRTCEIPKAKAYRAQAELWYPIARAMAQNPEATQALLKAIRSGNKQLTRQADKQAEPMVEMLVSHGLATVCKKTNTEIYFELRDEMIHEFLMGDWLEVFVWHEAQHAGFAEDCCQWGHKIVVDQKTAKTLPSNELDLALTYRARLLIAECKSSAQPFAPGYLDKLYSISNLVGGAYVRQVFITNTLIPSDKTKESFESFKRQADVRRIHVITGEQLMNVGTLLSEQVAATGQSR